MIKPAFSACLMTSRYLQKAASCNLGAITRPRHFGNYRINVLPSGLLPFRLSARIRSIHSSLPTQNMATVTTHESLNKVSTSAAPAAIGPYSQAIKVGDLLFCSGCIPLNPATMEVVEGGVQAQTKQALKNLKSVVEAGGSELGKVAKTTVFLKDMNDFAAVNAIYADFFGNHAPARSAVEVARLPKDVLVEVECIASLK
ncbi:Endoribonuclease L-PSP/chorismate mutase-like protein [Panaeolus papilionaceus]|nr:Endoribonuclease L-PSP/chorismate mutase-like protein [Panaeolus papilionaceus]